MTVWRARVVGAIDPDDFYDFQVNRPMVGSDERGHRRITWPGTQVAVASPPDLNRDVILVRGIEPNMRWRQFCAEILAACDDLGGRLVVTLGALLADTPHTRPIPVTGTATRSDERGHRRITWPGTQVAVASPPDLNRDVILVRGIEPNMRWRQFCAEILAACDDLGGRLVVTLGALLADTPHTRPIPVTGTATEPELTDRLKLEQSTYEGPTGIVGVFQDACVRLDIPAVSYWAAVPHYVAQDRKSVV